MLSILGSIDYVLENEGTEFVNHPNDKGGPTRFGITLKTLQSHRGKECCAEDVKRISRKEVLAIYEAHYWSPLKLKDLMDQNVATAIFDIAVNCGPSVAGMCAQSAANEQIAEAVKLGAEKLKPLALDGKLGPESIAEINTLSRGQMVRALQKHLMAHYIGVVKKDPSQMVFMKGWAARANRLLKLV